MPVSVCSINCIVFALAVYASVSVLHQLYRICIVYVSVYVLYMPVSVCSIYCIVFVLAVYASVSVSESELRCKTYLDALSTVSCLHLLYMFAVYASVSVSESI